MPRNINCKYYTTFAKCNHESRKILGLKRSCIKVTDIFAVCDLLETKVEIPDKIPSPPPIPKTRKQYCYWKQDNQPSLNEWFDTSCGREYGIAEGSGSIIYCPGCGKMIEDRDD